MINEEDYDDDINNIIRRRIKEAELWCGNSTESDPTCKNVNLCIPM